MVNWGEFDQFDSICDKYLPASGEGDSMATQIVTAITKLVYKFYNDGDVYDNTYALEGWANDLSSYANWLYTFINLKELDEISHITTEDEYTALLFKIANKCMNEDFLKDYLSVNKRGSIYDCDGPFMFTDHSNDDIESDDDYYYDDDNDDDEYY